MSVKTDRSAHLEHEKAHVNTERPFLECGISPKVTISPQRASVACENKSEIILTSIDHVNMNKVYCLLAST